MNSAALLLPVGVALPLLLALGLAWRGGRAALLSLAPWAALPALATALIVPAGSEVSLAWLFMGSRLGLDETGRVFLLFTAALWGVSGWFAQGYLSDDARRGRFFGFFLLAMAGNLGLILARDVVTFYVCFSLMSFASYGLVIHNGDEEALRAGRVYLALVVLGELLLFAALVLMVATADSILLRDVIAGPMHPATLALLLLGFGIKAGALPLHVWLPLAHPAAPVPASAVLSGAMIKAGLLGWIRFLPLGHEAFPSWGALLLGAGLAAAFYGALVGVAQSNPKTVLAYSSISQMGLITMPVGAALTQPALWPAAQSAILIYALHHALAKGALFLGVGVASQAGTRAQRRWLFLGLLVPALALIGAPFTSGALAKGVLKAGLAPLPAPWPGVLMVALPVAALGTTLLMARFLWVMGLKPAAANHARRSLRRPWTALLAAVAFATWVLPWAGDEAQEVLKPRKLWAAFWPLALGGLAAWAVVVFVGRNRAATMPRVPAGDWLACLEPFGACATRMARRARESCDIGRCRLILGEWSRWIQRRSPSAGSERIEGAFRGWTVAILMLLGIGTFLYLLL